MNRESISKARRKQSRLARREICHTEKELRSSRCQKAQDIADNTLSATTLNTLTHTKRKPDVVNDFML